MANKSREAERESYRKRLRIDRDKLDDEVSQHAELYEHVAELHVLAVADYDAIKQELDEVTAEEDTAIRERYVDVDKKDRPSETAIKRMLGDNKRVQDLSRELLDAKLLVDRFAVLKESYGQRSYMLRELAGMWIARHLSRTAHSAKEDMQEQAVARVRDERLRRR